MAKKKKIEIENIESTSTEVLKEEVVVEQPKEDEKVLNGNDDVLLESSDENNVLKEDIVEETKKEEVKENIIETKESFVTENDSATIENTIENARIETAKKHVAAKSHIVHENKKTNNKKPVRLSFDFFWNGQIFN